MDFSSLITNSDFQSWLDKTIRAKVKEELALEKNNSFALISVRANDSVAEAISQSLNRPLVPITRTTFGDGEKKIAIRENLRGKHIYVISTMDHDEDPDVSLANTMRVISALKRTCKVPQISLIAPCLWYQTQDKTHAQREPISVRDVADDLTRRGMNHIIVLALHSEQIEIAFNSFDHLKMEPVFGSYLMSRFNDNDKIVLISPDEGGVRLRKELQKNLKPEVIDGQASVQQLRVRSKVDEKELIDFAGDVDGKTGIILDDLLRSGSTMFQACKAAKQHGAKRVIGLATHFYGFDSKGKTFEQNLIDSGIDELVCTNSRGEILKRIASNPILASKITIIDVVPYLANAIRNYHTGGTIKDMLYKVGPQGFYKVIHQAGG